MQAYRVRTASNVLVERYWPWTSVVMGRYSGPYPERLVHQGMAQAGMRRMLLAAGLGVRDYKNIYRDC